MTTNSNSSQSNESEEDHGCGCHPDQKTCHSQEKESENDYKDKYLRLLAENENLRRRLQKESQDSIKFALQKVIVELLEPYDSFEKALFHAGYSPSEDVRNWAIGFKMIHQQFKDWLSSQGVHSFASKGQSFNAQLHEAVEAIATDKFPEGHVLEELSKGYKIHDRVLRHAKVTIAKSSTASIDDLINDAESDVLPQTSSANETETL